ncbi:N-lysine methyltransferase KMT5A-like, partial [Pecten maximus]|uniref:N-lysine methyltransferase KMT5A-like n=1 Tax=Pecten maximus TaxID=6579 RepID=UPI0014581A55
MTLEPADDCIYLYQHIYCQRHRCNPASHPIGMTPWHEADFLKNRKGVFATRKFRKGDFLLEYHGEFIPYQEGKTRENAYPLKFGSFIFFLNWKNKRYCVDATFSKRICRYVNDGIGECQNCIMKQELYGDRPHLCLYANKDIAVGDELRYDYGVSDLPWRKK